MDRPTLAHGKYYGHMSYDCPARHVPSALTCLSGTLPLSPLTRCTALSAPFLGVCHLRDLSKSFKALHILSECP